MIKNILHTLLFTYISKWHSFINGTMVFSNGIGREGFDDLEASINSLKERRKAVILAHYYQAEEIQDIADFVGDSLDLSRKASASGAKVIVFCGVRFMAEVAKILSPQSTVLLPDLKAGCSLEESCPADKFKAFRARHPDHIALTYINCSVEVKALSDVIVTSANAEDIIRRLPEDKPLMFAPDKYLGSYLSQKTNRDLLLWPGTCVVHEQFSERELVKLLFRHPQALLTAHPECPQNILRHAHHIGSTSRMLEFVASSPRKEFIIATEPHIIHQMEKLSPDKKFIPAPGLSTMDGGCSCSRCPFMALNTLEKLYDCLHDMSPQIELSEDTRLAALKPLSRMFELSSSAKNPVAFS